MIMRFLMWFHELSLRMRDRHEGKLYDFEKPSERDIKRLDAEFKKRVTTGLQPNKQGDTK